MFVSCAEVFNAVTFVYTSMKPVENESYSFSHMLFLFPLLVFLFIFSMFLHIFLAVSSLQGTIKLCHFCDKCIPSTRVHCTDTHTNYIIGRRPYTELRAHFSDLLC